MLRARIALSFSLFALAACEAEKPKKAEAPLQAEPPKPAPASDIDPARVQLFAPALPESMDSAKNPGSAAKEALGRQLYFDTRLSKNRDVSCNSCHDLATFGVDNKPVSEGHKKQTGARNSPTVYNAAGHFVQFWDGRAADVEEQAKGPILNPVEMAMPDEKFVLTVVKSIPGYVAAFKAAFPEDKDPVTYDNLARAIGAFERKLVTPSRWDAFVKGDKSALSAEEKAGFNKFFDSGCIACHTGTYVGGMSYQKLGAVKPWPNTKDQGRFDHTKADADKMMFKVPGLRNVERTAPYYHDGSVATLDEAVKKMAEHQLGKTLSDDDTKAIVAWLKTLTGELPTAYIAKPELPADGPKTPKASL